MAGDSTTSRATPFFPTRSSAVAALAAALLAWGLAGCGSDDSAPDSADDSLASDPGQAPTTEDLRGTEYISMDVSGYDLVEGSTITLGFGDGMSVSAGCNTMAAEYAVSDDGTLAWTGEPATTMMACSDELEAQDQWLTQLFQEGLTAATEGTALTLTNGEVIIELAP